MMEQIVIDECCDLGVKDSCVTCELSRCCNGKWSHTTHQNATYNRKF